LAPEFWRNELPHSFGVEVHPQFKKNKGIKEMIGERSLKMNIVCIASRF
jgi:hypothetical protein